MKTKLIGGFCLFIGVLAFIDTVKFGGVSLGTWHLRPFILPAFALGLGWIELHGRETPFVKKWNHLAHVLLYLALCAIVIALSVCLQKHK